jgi:gamma-carbonic anhydrase
MLSRSFNGHTPEIHPTAFIAENVTVIGRVTIGAHASVWYGAVLRGDINDVSVGAYSNIQDGVVLHVTHELPVRVGSHVTVGHGAIVHGCTVYDECLIGMGAIVLDNAVVGPRSLVAAGSLVKQGFLVPEGKLVAGVPARIIRELTDEERASILESAHRYVSYADEYKNDT